jgi:hypothetical protein
VTGPSPSPSPPRRRNPLLGPDAAPEEPGPVPAGGERDRGLRHDTRNVGRRVDPTGKHALFATPPAAAPDQLRAGSRETGRSAFYSTGSRQVGTVVVECAACTTRTRVTLVDLGIRFLSVSAWIPGRSHSHWMRCPACDTHTWCRVGWTD